MISRLLVVAMLLAGAGAGTGACVDNETSCRLVQSCMPCTMEGCAWCFETGTCQDPMVVCPGEVALAPEQCEQPAASGDAGTLASARSD
jgi:hypothetical protein